MTSSVNGLEFFLGSIIPVIILSTAVNVLCVFIVQLTLSGSQWGAYLIITTVCTFIASVVGMIFGIYAKTQVSASTITTPALINIYDGSDVVRIQQHFRKDLKIFSSTGIALKCYICNQRRESSDPFVRHHRPVCRSLFVSSAFSDLISKKTDLKSRCKIQSIEIQVQNQN